MALATFDTLKFAQFSEAIAGQLATRAELINLATKDDVSAVKDELKRLEGKIEASKSETLR